MLIPLAEQVSNPRFLNLKFQLFKSVYMISCSKVARALVLILVAAWGIQAYSKPFDCSKNCGLPEDAPYPNIVVGTVDGVATEEQSKQIFAWARRHGFWKTLPASNDKFWQSVQLVSLNVKGKRSMTFLISQSEAKAAPFIMGDWARFSPHRGAHEKPPENDKEALAYWNAVGCVLVMCRGGKSVCDGRYLAGIYRTDDGVALKNDGKTDDLTARPIDPNSMLPR